MVSHDNYDNSILKSLQRISNSLEKIEKKIPNKPIKTENENRESLGLPRIDDEEFLKRIVDGEDTLPSDIPVKEETSTNLTEDIFEMFEASTGITEEMVIDYRPCTKFYCGVDIPNAIVVELRDKSQLIYIPK